MKVKVEVTRDFGPLWKWAVFLYDEDMRCLGARISFFDRSRRGAERRARRAAGALLRSELRWQSTQAEATHFTLTPDDLERWES